MDWYFNEAQKLHPIIKASRVHIDFVEIHPFIDGNGRTSRLLNFSVCCYQMKLKVDACLM